MPRRLLLASFGLAALAAGTPASARTLTVREAVALSLEHSHAVEAARWGEEKAKADVGKAFFSFFPSVTATGGYTFLGTVPYVEFDMSAMSGGGGSDPCAEMTEDDLPDGWTLEMAQGMCYMIMGWMAGDPNAEPTRIAMGLHSNWFGQLTVEQVVFAGGAMHQSYAASRDLLDASEEQVRLAEQKAAYDAESGFYQLLLAREAVKVTTAAEETMNAYVRDLQAVVDVGAGNKADLLAAQAQQSKARLDALKTAHGAKIAEAFFRVLIGLDPGEPIDLATEDLAPVEALPVARDKMLVEALARRPDLAALDSTVSALGHYSNATWASWLPAVFVQGTLKWANPDYSLERRWYRSEMLTVAASWTLWDRGSALYGHRGMRAQRLQAAAQREMLAEYLGIEIETAITTYDASIEELEVAKDGVEASEEAYRLENERFKLGASNNTQLLAAHAALSGARLSLLQAQTQMRIAHAALRKAIGLDPEVAR